MSLEAAIVERLLGDATFSTALGTRIDWMRRPGKTLPAATLQIISDPRPQHLKGFQRVRPTRVQLDIWAARPGDAITLREHAIAVLTPSASAGGVRFQRAQIINVRPAFDGDQIATDQQPQGELYREIVDIIFTHDA